jgi:RNA polymerase sigma-70 factor (ECF subfamily)
MVSAMHGSDTHAIWLEFGDRLRVFIARRVRSEADAEDILQDVFLRVHQRAGDLNHADRLTSWLFQVTRNAIVDYYRSPVRREQPESLLGAASLDLAGFAEPEPAPDLDSALARQELSSCLRPLVERLPPPYREAVALVDLGGAPQTEAAAQLGLSVSGMKSRVQRGRRALKEILVECCPVQLDAGGRVVDYDRPGPACPSCAAPAAAATVVAPRGSHHGRCCAPVIGG